MRLTITLRKPSRLSHRLTMVCTAKTRRRRTTSYHSFCQRRTSKEEERLRRERAEAEQQEKERIKREMEEVNLKAREEKDRIKAKKAAAAKKVQKKVLAATRATNPRVRAWQMPSLFLAPAMMAAASRKTSNVGMGSWLANNSMPYHELKIPSTAHHL
jgi:hypothetical protein